MARERITKETCLECGACCVCLENQPAYCDITPADEKRLGKKFVRLNVIFPKPFEVLVDILSGGAADIPHAAIKTKRSKMRLGPLKGLAPCRCVALEGTLFERIGCSVYPRRPRACRVAVKPGDKWCRQMRKLVRAQGFEP